VDAQRIWDGQAVEGDRLRQDGDVFDGLDVDAQPAAEVLQVFDGAELKLP